MSDNFAPPQGPNNPGSLSSNSENQPHQADSYAPFAAPATPQYTPQNGSGSDRSYNTNFGQPDAQTNFQSAPPGGIDPRPDPTYGAYQPNFNWRAVKPGIVPIRPLNLGDILTGTFQLFRFNIKPTLAYSALVTIFINIIFLPLTVFFSAQLSSYIPENVKTNQSAGMHTLFLFSAAPTTIATALLVPALTYVTLQAVLGNKVTISETWKTIKGTVLTYISAVIILGILLSLIFVIVVVEAFAIYTTTGSDSITIITTLASLFVATIFYIFLAVRFIFTGPTVVLERRSVFAALKRSWQLTKGNEWRIFGITLLGSLLIAFVMNVVLVPLTVAFTLLPIILGTKGSSAAVITTLITSLSSIISNIVTAPWNNALTTLLYTDVRFRDEAYDLELLKQLTK